MQIEESDFRLTNDGSSVHWDLELMKTVRPRGKPERQEFGDPMYGMPLEKCIKIIVNHRLAKQEKYTLKEFIEAYLKELDNVKLLFKDL